MAGSKGSITLLGIARALLRNPAILLLDEPTSSLDSQTERRVQQTLRKASQDRTTVLITHRLNMVVDADEIWVMDRGDIVERGRTATNYQLLPGDRLYIKSDPWIKVDTFLGKVYAPFERTASFVQSIVNAEELVRAAATIPGGLYSGGLFGFGFPGVFGF